MNKYHAPWTEKQLRHLLRRCLFGVTLEDYNFFKGKNMDQCLEILLDTASNPLPELYYMEPKTQTVKVYEWEKFKAYMIGRVGLQASCILPMINQPRNIGEQMVLFWHNHFATQFNTTKSGVYTWQYFLLLRKYVAGNFKKLLREMTTNVQMLVYLNGNMNNKDAPNENYARELQELFSLGKGPKSHYNEEDVHAAAKVLTGWKVNEEKFFSFFDPNIHDTSNKSFSAFYDNHKIKGRSGAEGAQETDELIDMICAQQEVSKFMCRKLYRWFVHSTIDAGVENNVIMPLAEIMLKSNYEVKPVLMAMLSSDFFYEPGLIGGIIKNPLDFTIGLTREFNLKNEESDKRPEGFFEVPFGIAFLAGNMGQEICNPPSVAGWPAYYEYPLYDKEWLTSAVFGQASLINKLTSLDRSNPDDRGHLDLLAFVKTLSNPGDSEQWLTEAMSLMYAVPSGPGQIAHLHNLLDTGPKFTEKWNELWRKYSADKDNAELLVEIRIRLKNAFINLLTYPEYHLK